MLRTREIYHKNDISTTNFEYRKLVVRFVGTGWKIESEEGIPFDYIILSSGRIYRCGQPFRIKVGTENYYSEYEQVVGPKIPDNGLAIYHTGSKTPPLDSIPIFAGEGKSLLVNALVSLGAVK